jgi:hypothetical protein
MVGGRRQRLSGQRYQRTGGRKARQRAVTAARGTVARVLTQARLGAQAHGIDQDLLVSRLLVPNALGAPERLVRDVVWYDRDVQRRLAAHCAAMPELRRASACAEVSRAMFDALAADMLGTERRYRGHVHPLAWLAWYDARKGTGDAKVELVDHGRPCSAAQWDLVRPGFVRGLRAGRFF